MPAHRQKATGQQARPQSGDPAVLRPAKRIQVCGLSAGVVCARERELDSLIRLLPAAMGEPEINRDPCQNHDQAHN